VTYPGHAKGTEDTPPLAANGTPVLDLRAARVAVHLRQLQLRLDACALW
jgi:hypothetical protein